MQNYNNDDKYNSNNKYNYDNLDNKMDQFKMMMTFKKMMSNMKNDDSFMSEKMMPYDMMKSQHVFEEQQSKVGNMTCVLREMNCLNAENEIDIRAMKQDIEQFNMPSAWFKNRYEEILDVC